MRQCFLFLLILIIVCGISFGMTCCGFSYSKIIKSIASELDLDYSLIKSICKVESGFNKDSISPKEAIGIMQLIPSTAEEICIQNNLEYSKDRLFDPNFNIYLGSLYLKRLLSRYPLEWAICAYNAGPSNVDVWISSNISFKDIPYKETRLYLKKVMKYKKIYDLYQ